MNKIKPEVHINNSIFQKINLDIPQIIKKRIYQQNKQVVYKQNLMLYDDPNEAWETIKKFIKFINIRFNIPLALGDAQKCLLIMLIGLFSIRNMFISSPKHRLITGV